MVLISLLIPIIFLIYFLIARKHINKTTFQWINVLLIVLMLLISLPITLSSFKYSNWILRFLNIPILLTASAFLISKLLYKFKKLVWVFFLLAFLLNTTYQGLTIFGAAFGGGDYPSRHNYNNGNWKFDDLIVDTWIQQGFAGPPFRNYDVYKLSLKGLVYKKIANSINPDTLGCIINIKGFNSSGDFKLNICVSTIELPSGVVLQE